jgi:hypothetical protein
MLDQEKKLHLRRIMVRVWQGKPILREDKLFLGNVFEESAVDTILAQLSTREINTSQAEVLMLSARTRNMQLA